MAKLTDKQRKKIIAEHIEGASIRALASKYKVSTTTIQRTIHGDTDFAQKVTEKKEANAKQVLAHMDEKKEQVCTIVDKILLQMGDEEKIKATPLNQLNCIVVDPSAASFIECIRRHGEYIVRKANNNVLDGIRTVGNMLQSGTIKIHENCKDAIREFRLYRWDEQKTADAVIKENDHAMDDIRYFCYTVLRRELQYDEW